MSGSMIDTENWTVTRTTEIAAPRALVWGVVTNPVHLAQWFGQSADFPDGIVVGATGVFGWTEHGECPARIDVVDPITTFAFTWSPSGEEIRSDTGTTATFTLADSGDGGTVLTVHETGFDALSGDAARRRAALEGNAQGWNQELDDLAAHVDTLVRGGQPQSDLDRGMITHNILVDADISTVWATLTSESAIEAWWGHPARFPGGIREGAAGTFEWRDHGFMPMRVERLEEPHRFDLLWGELGDDEPGPDASYVAFTLMPAEGATVITVVETGFDSLDTAKRRAAMEENVKGWQAVLDSLAAHIARP